MPLKLTLELSTTTPSSLSVGTSGKKEVSTSQMGDAIISKLK